MLGNYKKIAIIKTKFSINHRKGGTVTTNIPLNLNFNPSQVIVSIKSDNDTRGAKCINSKTNDVYNPIWHWTGSTYISNINRNSFDIVTYNQNAENHLEYYTQEIIAIG